MRAPNGSVIRKHGVYREIVAPDRLVLTYVTDDLAGNPGPETLVTVTLADHTPQSGRNKDVDARIKSAQDD